MSDPRLTPQPGYVTWYWLDGETHRVSIEPRPAYCDRGHFVAKVFPQVGAEPGAYTIDEADGWPRYYMDFGRMIDELTAWLRWRESDGPSREGEAFWESSEPQAPAP